MLECFICHSDINMESWGQTGKFYGLILMCLCVMLARGQLYWIGFWIFDNLVQARVIFVKGHS